MSDKRKSANEQSAELAPHYKKSEKGGKQHWDRMWEKYREAWFVGNITKYVERYRDKNGMADLIKARHYLDKLIELEQEEADAANGLKVDRRKEERSVECVVQDGHGFGHLEGYDPDVVN
jgi:hypothetical protein